MKYQKNIVLDAQERSICESLIKNPRLSDNQISIRKNIPVKTVNRKRKKLEAQGILQYRCYINKQPEGTSEFLGNQLCVAMLRKGITRAQVQEILLSKDSYREIFFKHIYFLSVAEREGQICLVFWIQSNKQEDIVEILNADIIKFLAGKLGENPVSDVSTYMISRNAVEFTNYLPMINIENGKIKDSSHIIL